MPLLTKTRPLVLALFEKPALRRPLMTSINHAYGFGTIVTDTRGEFMAYLSREPRPDVVLMELCHRSVCPGLRSRPGHERTPIVMIDSFPQGYTSMLLAQAEAAFRSGATALICNTDDPALTARILRMALRSHGEVVLARR